MNLKIQFVKLHIELFKTQERTMLLAPEIWKHKAHRTAEARKIVKYAREKIGYSEKTSDCDLFRTLEGIYKEIMQAQ